MFGWLNRKSRTMTQVKQLMKVGNFDAAIHELDALATSYPADRDVGLHRAICLRAVDRDEDALQDLQCIEHHFARDASVWEMRGGLLVNLRRFEEALECLNRALDLDPRRQAARHSRGTCLLVLKRNREAMDDCLEYIESWPLDSNGYFLKASLHWNMGEGDMGLQAAEQGLGLDPGNVNLLVAKADLLCRSGRPQEALTAMDAAVGAGAPENRFSTARAFELVHAGRFAEAIPLLDAVIESDHGRGCYLMRAEAYAGLGKNARALEDRQAAARILQQNASELQRTGVRRAVVLIQAGMNLFEPGKEDGTALALLTFDDVLNADHEHLRRLARALFELKQKPLGANPALRLAASALSNDFGIDNRRQKLPLELTDGAQCYTADLNIYRDYLPLGRLTPETEILTVLAEPGDTGRIELLPIAGSIAAS
jgi:tetratricopeptide (TPR) repeat protein